MPIIHFQKAFKLNKTVKAKMKKLMAEYNKYLIFDLIPGNKNTGKTIMGNMLIFRAVANPTNDAIVIILSVESIFL